MRSIKSPLGCLERVHDFAALKGSTRGKVVPPERGLLPLLSPPSPSGREICTAAARGGPARAALMTACREFSVAGALRSNRVQTKGPVESFELHEYQCLFQILMAVVVLRDSLLGKAIVPRTVAQGFLKSSLGSISNSHAGCLLKNVSSWTSSQIDPQSVTLSNLFLSFIVYNTGQKPPSWSPFWSCSGPSLLFFTMSLYFSRVKSNLIFSKTSFTST